ncbi:pseudouridine-5'-phosphate glycosidase [Shigella flexneri]
MPRWLELKHSLTGRIGVYRGAEHTFDISADLQELAHTDVTVICAGAQSDSGFWLNE